MPTGRPSHMMGVSDAIQNCLVNYVNFKGRASRSEYGWFLLFTFLLMMVVFFYLSWQMVALWLLTLMPLISVSVRRLHDLGMSGWFMMLFMIPLINTILMYVVLPFIEGEGHPNQYGTVPTNKLGVASGVISSQYQGQSCKFVLDSVFSRSPVTFKRDSDTENAPLAQKLLELPYIVEVNITGDVMTLTGNNVESWPTVGKEIKAVIREQIESGKPAIIEATMDVKLGLSSYAAEKLKDAKELLDRGVITEKEFQEIKDKYLD